MLALAAQLVERLGQAREQLLGVLQRPPLGAQARGLFRLRCQGRQLVDGVAQIGLVGPGLGGAGLGGRRRVAGDAPDRESLGGDRRLVTEKAVGRAMGVDHGAVGRRVAQAVLVELRLQLDQAAAEAAQYGGADGLVVDERAAAAIGPDNTAQHQLSLVDVDAMLGGIGEDGMARRRLENGGNGRLGGAGTDQAGIAAGAECEAEAVEEDRFAGAGLAREHAETGREVKLQAVDQDDVADRQSAQHGRLEWPKPAQ